MVGIWWNTIVSFLGPAHFQGGELLGVRELKPSQPNDHHGEMVTLIASQAPVGLLLQFLVPRSAAWPWYLWPTECCWTQTAAWPQKTPGRPGSVEPPTQMVMLGRSSWICGFFELWFSICLGSSKHSGNSKIWRHGERYSFGNHLEDVHVWLLNVEC